MVGHFHQGFHFLGALERTPDIVVTGAGVEGQQLEAMRTLHLRASRTRWPRSGNIIEHFQHFDFELFRRPSGRLSAGSLHQSCWELSLE